VFAIPLVLATNGPSADVYATSTSLSDAVPVAAETTPAASNVDPTGDIAAANAAAANAADAPPALAADPSGAPAAVTAAPAGKVPEPPAAAAGIAAAPAAASPSRSAKGTITIVTFGYDFGPAPSGSRFVANVRNIDAGTFPQTVTGLMPDVANQILATAAAQEWLAVFRGQWEPALKSGDQVAIGCARGHHRSVALGVVLANDLSAQGYTVNLVHRDILKSW
jgi:hypothetical protein